MSGIPSTKPLMEGYEAERDAQNPYPSDDAVRWRAWFEGQQMAAEHLAIGPNGWPGDRPPSEINDAIRSAMQRQALGLTGLVNSPYTALPNGQMVTDWHAPAEAQRQTDLAAIWWARREASAETARALKEAEAKFNDWARSILRPALASAPQVPAAQAPHPNAAHAAPVARALNRSRKQQTASSWDRAIWQPEDGR